MLNSKTEQTMKINLESATMNQINTLNLTPNYDYLKVIKRQLVLKIPRIY